MKGDASLRKSRTTLPGGGVTENAGLLKAFRVGHKKRGKWHVAARAAGPFVRTSRQEVRRARGPSECIPNPRFLLQIFDLEKESRASAGQAARFQRAACLADMRGGFGSLAPARLPYAVRRLRRKGACAQWALGPKAQSDLQA